MWYVALPAGTWAIYLTDHWLDVYQNPTIDQPRHVFIKQYQTQIALLIALLASLSIYLLVSYLPITFWLTAGVLGICSLVYFGLSHSTFAALKYYYNKELVVAFIYSTALYLPIGLQQPNWFPWFAFYGLQLVVAYLNLLMISIIEMPSDSRSGQFSWVQMIGSRRATRFFDALTMIAIGSAVVLAILTAPPLRQLALVLASMALFHFGIFRYQSSLQFNETYRKLGEVIFWLPALVYLLS